MARRIMNIDEVEFTQWGHGMSAPGLDGADKRFEARLGPIGYKLGARKLGYNLTVVPAGKRAFPLHNHRTNEEMFFILEGSGEIRIGKERHPIRRGDVIACPPGGPEDAHQIINTGATDLKYLSVSTMTYPELCDYPDSKKLAMFAELPPDEQGRPQRFRFVSRTDANMNYWDGETGEVP